MDDSTERSPVEIGAVDAGALEGAALDAAVARLEGWTPPEPQHQSQTWTKQGQYEPLGYLDFSRDWALGGPIIERHGIELQRAWLSSPPVWYASCGDGWLADGPTPLIAAMRAYVAQRASEGTSEARRPDDT